MDEDQSKASRRGRARDFSDNSKTRCGVLTGIAMMSSRVGMKCECMLTGLSAADLDSELDSPVSLCQVKADLIRGIGPVFA